MTTEAALEHLPDHRFRVSGTGRYTVFGEGDTPDAAVAAFVRAASASRLITVDLPDTAVEAATPSASDRNSRVANRVGVADDIPSETWAEFLQLLAERRQHVSPVQVR